MSTNVKYSVQVLSRRKPQENFRCLYNPLRITVFYKNKKAKLGMARTSVSQFEVIVEFMERNGDLNKPVEGPHGRITAAKQWAELASVLNLDTTGASRPVEKWKKVWSDFKNNTKRKAAKIHRAASGTGGGPASKLVLTDLEQRVLALTGSQAATGLVGIDEVGVLIEPEASISHAAPPPPPSPSVAAPPSQSPTPFYYDYDESQVENIIEVAADENESAITPITPFVETVTHGVISPTTHSAHVGGSPFLQTGVRPRPLTPRRSRPLTPRRPRPLTPRRPRPLTPRRPRQLSPRRRRQRPLDTATAEFLACDERWQQFARDFATEQNNLRERELEMQAQWQNLFAEALAMLNNHLNN